MIFYVMYVNTIFPILILVINLEPVQIAILNPTTPCRPAWWPFEALLGSKDFSQK